MHSDRIDRLHGEIGRAAEPLTPMRLQFDDLGLGPLPPQPISPTTTVVTTESKLRLLEERCVAALGDENFRWLSDLCEAAGGQLEMECLPPELRELGDERISSYAPVVEQLVFLRGAATPAA